MFRHFVNKCSSGSTCAFTEGGDKELLRYGDLAMKKLFEQTKQMKNAMYEILQMVESEYNTRAMLIEVQIKKAVMKQVATHVFSMTIFVKYPLITIIYSGQRRAQKLF